MSRTPLILIIMKLPFQAAKLLLYGLGSITYLPIYLYCLIFSKFLFSELFETSPMFYVIFCLPRALISLGAFAIAAAELYLMYWGINRYYDFHSQEAVAFTLAVIAIVTLFSFRYGYNLLFKKLNFPKLKSVSQHFRLVYNAFEDILSALLSILTVAFIFRAKQLFSYQSEPGQRKYLSFAFTKLIHTLYDLIGLFSYIILVLLPWRLPYTRRVVPKINTEEGKLFFKIYQAFNAVLDLILVPMFLIVLLNPFFKCRRLLNHMNRLSVIAWRRLVFDEFINTLVDIPCFVLLVVSAATLYQLPYSCILYTNILRKIKPYTFRDEDRVSLKRVNNHQVQDAFSEEIYKENFKVDSSYKPLCIELFGSVIMDVFLLATHLILLVSIYRYPILLKKMNTRKIDRSQKPEHLTRNITLTYLEHRAHLKNLLQLNSEPEPQIVEGVQVPANLETSSTYPRYIISELCDFLADIPCLIIGSLLILAPWRWPDVLRQLKAHWNSLNSLEGTGFTSWRCDAIGHGFLVGWDYVSFALFPVVLTAFWRWNYTFTKFAQVLRAGFIEEPGLGHMRGMTAFDYFVLETFVKIVADLLYLPFILLFTPFLIFCPWRLCLLAKCLNATTRADFNVHRVLAVKIGCLALCDFLQLIPLTMTILTLIRIPTLWKMVKKFSPNRAQDDPSQLQVRLIDHLERSVMEDVAANQQDLHAPPLEDLEENQNYQQFQQFQQVRQFQQQFHPQAQEEAPQAPEDNPPNGDDIRKRHEYIALLDAGNKACILMILDLLSLPFLILAQVNCVTGHRYRNKVAKFTEAIKTSQDMEGYYNAELDICFARFKYGVYSIADIIGKIFLTAIFLVLLWRMPTLFIFVSREDLKEKSLSEELRNQPKIKVVGFILINCFLHFLLDLIYLPFFALLIVLTPWRSWPVLSQAYRYNTESTVDDQISQQRSLVITQLYKGITDILAVVQLVLLIVTLIRLPFLFVMILKNRFPNSWLAAKLCPSLRNPPLAAPAIGEERVHETKLSWGRCINISFKEFLKDLFCIPFGAIALVLAPWRIPTIFSIIASQVDRIPTQDVAARKLSIYSRRGELVVLVWTILTLDLPYLFLMILSCLTLYGAPFMVRILFRYIWNFKKYESGERIFAKEVSHEFKKIFYNLLKLIFTILILVLVSRVPTTIKRLQRVFKEDRKKEQERQYIEAVSEKKPKEGALSIKDMNWDVYGRMCQFLTVEDLAKLSQVNQKFNNLNKKDFFWEYQFKRDFKNQNNFDGAVSYKEKCIGAYLRNKHDQLQQPMNEEQRDILRGTLYVLFDEFLLSLRSIPQIPLLPFKFLGFLLLKIFGDSLKANSYLPSRCSHFIDCFRFMIIRPPVQTNQSNFEFDDATKSAKNIHTIVVAWILILSARIIADIGFIISYILCFIMRILSAGQVSPMRVERVTEETDMQNVPVIERHQLAEYPYRVLRFPLYVLQFVFFHFNLILLIGAFGVPSTLTHAYLGWNWIESVVGPCFSFLIYYAIIFNVGFTEILYANEAAPYFTPSKALTEPILLVIYLLQKAYTHFAKPLFILLKNGIRALCKGFFTLLSLLCSAASTAATTVCQFIFSVGQGIYGSYIAILSSITRCTLKFGIIGDLFLTVFALAWMLWPIAIPFFLPNKIYFIPCGLICLVLIVVGYKEIQKVTKNFEEEQNANGNDVLRDLENNHV